MADRADDGTSRIYLLRHAHAAWAAPRQRDIERALDERGIMEAGRIAMTMAVNGLVPECVLASPARRAAETVEIIAEKTRAQLSVCYCMELYTGGHEAYVMAIARQKASSVLVVGHGPMIDDAARALVCRRCGSFSGPLASGFPTGGLAVIELSGPLSTAQAGLGRLAGFLSPRDG